MYTKFFLNVLLVIVKKFYLLNYLQIKHIIKNVKNLLFQILSSNNFKKSNNIA